MRIHADPDPQPCKEDGILLKKLMLPVYFLLAGAGAGEKIPGAGQKRTGSATLNICNSTCSVALTKSLLLRDLN